MKIAHAKAFERFGGAGRPLATNNHPGRQPANRPIGVTRDGFAGKNPDIGMFTIPV
jgi:hypothetical protein